MSNSKTWLTSDLHLFHDNIIKYCNRDYKDAEEMNADIISVWKNTVDINDRVIFVGDLSAGLKGRRNELSDVCKSLPGKKTLIRGNHDHETDQWYLDNGFDIVLSHLYEDNILYIHKPATPERTQLTGLVKKFNPKIIIHGHIHDAGPELDGHFNVAWDRHKRLIDLNEIK